MQPIYCPGFNFSVLELLGLGYDDWCLNIYATTLFVFLSSDTLQIWREELSMGMKQWLSCVPGTILARRKRARISGTAGIYVTQDEVSENEEFLNTRFLRARTVPGTRENHCFIPMDNSSLQICRVSEERNTNSVVA